MGLVGKIVFDWLRGRANGGAPPWAGEWQEAMQEIKEDVQWLRDLHDRRDPNGMPLCYMPRRLHETLEKLHAQAIQANVLLERVLAELRKSNDQ